MSKWDVIKRNKKIETGLVEDEIDFSVDGGGISLTLDITKVGHIVTVLKNFKNPYVGNKRKLIPFIVKVIDKYNIKYNSVLDLFCGSAFCSMAFKMLDKKVISNDILSGSYLNAVAFVKNKDTILLEEDIRILFSGDSIESCDSVVISDKYLNRLDEAEVAIIVSYFQQICKMWGHPLEGNLKSALAWVYMQNYIIENCFVGGRLNCGQILAKYDHRIDHPRNKGNAMFFNGNGFSYSDMRFQKPIYSTDSNQHECYNMDAIELLETVEPQVDLAYIDPPYGGSQSDYGFMYSLFEEMLHGSSYEEIAKQRFGVDRFINKANYKDNFNDLIKASKYIPNIIISYNDTSWGTIEEIIEVVRNYRKNISVEEFSYSYNYRRQDNNDKGTKEYVIIVKE